ncbi:hypothetical protein OSTOST_14268 [Ostertagia ostertagi]
MDDVWTKVFSYLSPREVLKCERVSRAWRRLAHRALRQLVDPTRVRISQKQFLTPKILCCLHRFPQVIHYKLSKFPFRNIIACISELCSRRLRRVIFRVTSKNEKYSVFASEHHLTKAVIEALASTATALRSIIIDRVKVEVLNGPAVITMVNDFPLVSALDEI